MAIQHVDLPGIFLAAEQVKRSRQQRQLGDFQLQQQQQAAAQQQALLEAQRQAAAGDPTAFQTQFPTQFQEFQTAQQKAQQEQLAAQSKLAGQQQQQQIRGQEFDVTRKNRTIQHVMGALQVAQQNPEAWGQIRQNIAQQTEAGNLDPDIAGLALQGEGIPDPAALQQALPQFAPAADPTRDQIALAQQFRISPLQVPHHPEASKLLQEAREADIARRGQPLVEVQVGQGGDVAAGKAVRQDVQRKLLTAKNDLNMIGEIKSIATNPATGRPDWSKVVGLMPSVKKFGYDLLSAAGSVTGLDLTTEAGKDEYTRLADFRAWVDEYRAGKLRELLGAAQTDAEIKNVANSLLSPGMSPVQFEATLGKLERTLNVSIEIAQQVLAEGFSTGNRDWQQIGGLAFGQEVDRRMRDQGLVGPRSRRSGRAPAQPITTEGLTIGTPQPAARQPQIPAQPVSAGGITIGAPQSTGRGQKIGRAAARDIARQILSSEPDISRAELMRRIRERVGR